MENPPNPLDSQAPLDPNQNPFEDPLLDALEHSIENPPGFADPLAENDGLLIDDPAKQLDAVEAGIENAPRVPPEPEIVKDSNKPDEKEDEKAPPPADSYESPKMREEVWGTFQSSPPLPREGSAHTPPPNPPLPKLTRGGTGIRGGRGPIFKGRIPGQLGRTMVRTSHNLRFCPESRELIDEKKCQSCEKYRHWPQGSNEEPRECWYDWQAIPPGNESDDGTH